MKVSPGAAAPLLAALLWTAALIVDPGPLGEPGRFLVAFGMLTLSSVAVAGMVVAGGRWAWRTSVGIALFTLAVAVLRPVDVLWGVALIGSAVSLIALFLPSLTVTIRKLPSAAGPPPRAVVVILSLLMVPAALGLALWDRDGTFTLVVALSAPLASFWYARVFPGGLYVVRLLWPAVAVGLAVVQDPIPGAVSALSGIVVAVLAAHREVRVAFYPPREQASVHPIPPELVPKEILDAAHLDEHGRPR